MMPALNGPAALRDHELLMRRARAEFLEMPGLRLIPAQAARLWAVDRATCERILDMLVADGFLWRTPSGAYLR